VISIQTKKFTERTAGHCDIIDITARIHQAIEREQIHHGSITAFVSGSTAALTTTIEYESGLIQDLKESVERLIPSDRRYDHDDRWDDDNGFSHLRAAFLGPSIALPVQNGKVCLQTWQQVILLDFDNRPRAQEIILQLIGETE
jgi:secondary thiamine-phosphate synthase enzyme